MLKAILSRYQGEKYFDFSPERIIEVLSRIPRFVGWGDGQISVLEHSIHTYLLCKAECPINYRLQLLCLIHDFPECIYGDIPSYIKEQFPQEVKTMLWLLDKDLYSKLGIEYPTHSEKEIVRKYDHIALSLEAQYVFGSNWVAEDWPPLPVKVPLIDLSNLYLRNDPHTIYYQLKDLAFA